MLGAGDTKINEKEVLALGRKSMSQLEYHIHRKFFFSECSLWVSSLS